MEEKNLRLFNFFVIRFLSLSIFFGVLVIFDLFLEGVIVVGLGVVSVLVIVF